jgi:hypothetical protein
VDPLFLPAAIPAACEFGRIALPFSSPPFIFQFNGLPKIGIIIFAAHFQG